MTDINVTLQERGARCGKFMNHAHVTRSLKKVFEYHNQENICCLAEDQLEALDMIAHKIGCILAGDPNYADSWVDIAGYAMLVANRLNRESGQ